MSGVVMSTLRDPSRPWRKKFGRVGKQGQPAGTQKGVQRPPKERQQRLGLEVRRPGAGDGVTSTSSG